MFRASHTTFTGYLFWLCIGLSIGAVSPSYAQGTVTLNIFQSERLLDDQTFITETERHYRSLSDISVEFKRTLIDDKTMSLKFIDGDFDLLFASVSSVPSDLPANRRQLSVFEAPFLFPDTNALSTVQASSLGSDALGQLSLHGIYGLVYVNSGFNWFATRRRIATVNDFKGMNVGVRDTWRSSDLAETLGFKTIPMPHADISAAWNAGSVDTLAGPPRAVAAAFADNNYTGTLVPGGDSYVGVMLTSKERWDRLPYRVQSALLKALQLASSERNRELIGAEQSAIKDVSPSSLVDIELTSNDTRAVIESWSKRSGADAAFVSEVISQVTSASPSNTPTRRERGGSLAPPLDILFATDRLDEGGEPNGDRFGVRRADDISCGRIQSIALNSKDLYELTLGDISSSRAECDKYISRTLQRSPSVLLFIHGYNTSFEFSVTRAAQFGRDIFFDGTVIVWSWASRGEFAEYDYDRESSNDTGKRLRYFVELLAKQPSDLTVLAHSMGNQPLLHVIDYLNGKVPGKKFRNVLFVAPDVAQDIFLREAPRINNLSLRATLYACGNDFALRASELKNSFPRAGKGGPGIVLPMDVEPIDVVGRTLSMNHSYVFDTVHGISDAQKLIRQDLGADGRGLQRREVSTGVYWILDD